MRNKYLGVRHAGEHPTVCKTYLAKGSGSHVAWENFEK